MSALRQSFASIRSLPNGWDGPASVTPDADVVARAASVLEYALKDLPLVETPAIVPVADGGLQAEWYTSKHRFEIYFEADGEIAAWSENRESGVEATAEGRDAIQMLIQWAANLSNDHHAIT